MHVEARPMGTTSWALSAHDGPSPGEAPHQAAAPAPKPVWWNLYAVDSGDGRLPPAGPVHRDLVRRAPTPAEATGKRTLVRAAFTAAVGGAVIALFSLAFGPRFFVSDVRALGILTGLVIVALAVVAPIGPESRKTGFGAVIIAAAIVAFPIAAGGYFVGSIVAIIGGALLVAYEPPKGEVVVTVRPAGHIRRFVALLVDFVAAFALHRILYNLVPAFFSTTLNVLVAWAFCWTVVSIVPTIWTRRTPGRILVVLRLVDLYDVERAEPVSVLARELLRGVIAIGGFFLVLRVALGADDLRILPALITVAGLAVAAAAMERFNVIDKLTGSVSVYDSIEYPDR